MLTVLLEALAPITWVVRSHARGTAHAASDIDLTPRPRDDYDPGADRGDRRSRERLMPEAIDVLAALNVPWHSPMVGDVVAYVDGTQVEIGEPMADLDPDGPPPTTSSAVSVGRDPGLNV